MPEQSTVLCILLMALSTYMTRIAGYLVLRDRTLTPRLQAFMESVPGCVLVSLIAPAFVSHDFADILALGTTVIAATRLPLLPTVLIGIVSSGVLRHAFG
jgi:uncharacterized membrane protein